MLPIQRAHYDAWVRRIEDELCERYPRPHWVVVPLEDLIRLPGPEPVPPWFQIVACTSDGRRCIMARLPFEPAVDESLFERVMVAFGREMERRLAEADTRL